MRIAIFTDYEYHAQGGRIFAERAFVRFIGRIVPHFKSAVVLGRLDPSSGRARYPLSGDVKFVPLPYYRSLSRPWDALRVMGRAAVRFWRALAEVDVVWLLGPNPVAIAFAVLASLRRRRVVLGVRQNYPAYVRARHPGRRGIAALAAIIDFVFRGLGRLHPVIVVGPELAEMYRPAPALLEIAVSLVDRDDIVDSGWALQREYGGELQVLSVGRLESEKNPLLLARILAELCSHDRRWKLIVCGEGPMMGELEAKLDELGVADRAEVRGYVAHGDELIALYRDSHAFLHVSWTEGLPQVLLESLAAGLPTVATDVGGVRAAVGGAALLVPAGTASEPVRALERIAADPSTRKRMVEAGIEYVSGRTLESESMKVARFIEEPIAGRPLNRDKRMEAA